MGDEEHGKEMTKEDKDAAGSAAMDDILGPEGVPESGENSLGPDESLAGSGPNYAFIDPTAEDTMIVQIILASRTGTREVAEEEEEEVKKEEPKEEKPEKEEDEDKENKENGDIDSEEKTDED